MDYVDKRVVITGGTTGLGFQTARRLVDGGARVLVTGRTQETVARAQQELGGTSIALRSDATSEDDRSALAAVIESELGGIDLLFINAGISSGAPFEEVTDQMYEAVFAINAKGPYFTVQRLAPLIAPGGAVVLTTSVVNVKGLPSTSVYAASKAALRSMTRTLARELLPRGVRVNAVSPGPIDTGILDRTFPPDTAAQMKNQFRQNNPMQRFGSSDEVAKAVLFLAFDATFTTGAELPVDGGVSQLL